ncbi:hypothetical protein, partial [Halobacillus sp. BBL2006]|uniref:hypothetical protein n=1 Tax=Halobacillus sp. BBL2006 TaxID=1543706 RepID=UPI0005420274
LFLILLTGLVAAGTSYWFSLNNTTTLLAKNMERQMGYRSDSFDTLFNTISHNVNRYAEKSELGDQEEEIEHQEEYIDKNEPPSYDQKVG